MSPAHPLRPTFHDWSPYPWVSGGRSHLGPVVPLKPAIDGPKTPAAVRAAALSARPERVSLPAASAAGAGSTASASASSSASASASAASPIRASQSNGSHAATGGSALSPATGGGSDGPTEPPASSVAFPAADTADERGRVVVGGDLEPGTILAAYRAGLFPMRQGDGRLAWWSPDPRGVLEPDRLRVSHSLHRAINRYDVRIDAAFEAVLEGCADRSSSEYAWITDEIRDAYLALHRLGWAHSVETWTRPAPGRQARLVGGLYGLAIGGLFAGESMFHREPDASKVALVGLVGVLRAPSAFGRAERIIDVQWLSPHLASLGATELPRETYLARLERVLAAPLPAAFAARGGARA